MEDNFTDEILSAVDDIQKIKKEKPTKYLKNHILILIIQVSQKYSRLIEEAEKFKN